MKQHYNTIIIGGGISGLACARELAQQNEDFLLITKDLQSDICTSTNQEVNYGAYVLGDNAIHMQSFITKKQRIRLRDIVFHTEQRAYSFMHAWKHPFQLIRVFVLVKLFQKQYASFKRMCETEAQVQAFKEHPYLLELYNTNAEEFIKRQKIETVSRDFLGQIVYMCTFTRLSELNAFDLMHVVMHMDIPIYTFTFNQERLIEGFKENITQDSVESIQEKERYVVTTASETVFTAQNVVVATPPHVSQELLEIPEIKGPCTAHLFHVTGSVKKKFSTKPLYVFHEQSDTIFLSRESDGSFLLYSQIEKPEFDEYFNSWNVQHHKVWDPAFHLKGHVLWETELQKNLYLIGEHNVCGVEDCFITGMYAARQITSKNK